ncbi:hypothetical protein DRW07_01480 [Alteromonas sediminis]|uniref:Uncharacterized protein n=1 Tax=Alteromonas sediminis TaxID=2259342 RepID=A0A3N5YQ43_9ALTE|nr:hypothetical protein [Alteromonas sediminis]RPJ68111.1 hypothetical protein DRW07_01480 [Alteromonas sediminis]
MNSRHFTHTVKMFSAATLMSSLIALNAFASDATSQVQNEKALQSEQMQVNEELSHEELAAELAKDIEVIEVTGSRPLGYFKRKSQLAELEFYQAFNDYVDVDKFKVKCRKESPLGSRVQHTVCYPQYLLSKLAKDSNFALQAGLRTPSASETDIVTTNEKAEFAKYSEELVKKHPELLAKLVEFGDAKKAYNERKGQ